MGRDTMTGLCDLYQDFVPFLQQITEKAADGLIARGGVDKGNQTFIR